MSTATDDQQPRFKAGDRVEHTIFGKGTVTKYVAHGRIPIDGGSITIAFDDHGSKELMTAFCGEKLKHIPRRGTES